MKIKQFLDSWSKLQIGVRTLNEIQLWSLLTLEREGSRRRHFIQRIYGKANKLRATRERKEYLT